MFHINIAQLIKCNGLTIFAEGEKSCMKYRKPGYREIYGDILHCQSSPCICLSYFSLVSGLLSSKMYNPFLLRKRLPFVTSSSSS